MATVHFTRNLQRLVDCPTAEVAGTTVEEVLAAYFAEHPRVRGYVLDEQGEVRKHIAIFVNDTGLVDRRRLSDAVGDHDGIHVMQALSGG